MNPPFNIKIWNYKTSKNDKILDADFCAYCFDNFLNDGGTLIGICSNSIIQENKAYKEFHNKYDKYIVKQYKDFKFDEKDEKSRKSIMETGVQIAVIVMKK